MQVVVMGAVVLVLLRLGPLLLALLALVVVVAATAAHTATAVTHAHDELHQLRTWPSNGGEDHSKEPRAQQAMPPCLTASSATLLIQHPQMLLSMVPVLVLVLALV